MLSCTNFFSIAFKRTEESVKVGVVLILKAIGHKEKMSYLYVDNMDTKIQKGIKEQEHKGVRRKKYNA